MSLNYLAAGQDDDNPAEQDPTPEEDNRDNSIEQDPSPEDLDRIFAGNEEGQNYFLEACKYLRTIDWEFPDREEFIFIAVLGSINYLRLSQNRDARYRPIITEATQFMIQHFSELVNLPEDTYADICARRSYEYAELVNFTYDYIDDNLEANAYDQE